VLINNTTIYFRSAENYEKLRGINAEYIFIDEAALIPRDAWLIIAATLRTGACRLYVSTTPKGRANWVYDLTKLGEDKVEVIYAKTTSNKHLPPEYYALLKTQYNTSFALQELEGEFIDGASLVRSEWVKKIDVCNIPPSGSPAGPEILIQSATTSGMNSVIYARTSGTEVGSDTGTSGWHRNRYPRCRRLAR
jgi:phage terminase large subunit-like protein